MNEPKQDPAGDIQWQRGGKQAVLRTYLKLHEGKLGAHWLWCAIEQIANGEPEAAVLQDFGYVPDSSLAAIRAGTVEA